MATLLYSAGVTISRYLLQNFVDRCAEFLHRAQEKERDGLVIVLFGNKFFFKRGEMSDRLKTK